MSSTQASDYPDIEIVAAVGGLSGDVSGTLRNVFGLTEEFYQSVYRNVMGKVKEPPTFFHRTTRFLRNFFALQPAFGLTPVLLRPFSRGRIMLKSRNPFHWPRMQPNFFSDQRDVETLTKGIRAV